MWVMKKKRTDDPLRQACRLNEIIAAEHRRRGLEWNPPMAGLWVEYDGNFWLCNPQGRAMLAWSQVTEGFIRVAAEVLTEPPEERQARLAARLAAELAELEKAEG